MCVCVCVCDSVCVFESVYEDSDGQCVNEHAKVY